MSTTQSDTIIFKEEKHTAKSIAFAIIDPNIANKSV